MTLAEHEPEGLRGIAHTEVVRRAARVDHLHARRVLTAGSVAAIALAALYTAVQQLRYHYLAQFEWPTRFHAAHTLAWWAVLLLAADALVELVRRPRPDP